MGNSCGVRKKMGVFEMICLWPLGGVAVWYIMQNVDIITGCNLKFKLSEK